MERASFMVAVVIGFDCGRAGGKASKEEEGGGPREMLLRLRVEGAKRRRSRQPKGGIKGPRNA